VARGGAGDHGWRPNLGPAGCPRPRRPVVGPFRQSPARLGRRHVSPARGIYAAHVRRRTRLATGGRPDLAGRDKHLFPRRNVRLGDQRRRDMAHDGWRRQLGPKSYADPGKTRRPLLPRARLRLGGRRRGHDQSYGRRRRAVGSPAKWRQVRAPDGRVRRRSIGVRGRRRRHGPRHARRRATLAARRHRGGATRSMASRSPTRRPRSPSADPTGGAAPSGARPTPAALGRSKARFASMAPG
jgi:hypothetical protein